MAQFNAGFPQRSLRDPLGHPEASCVARLRKTAYLFR